jgi:hypothetical protein
VNLATEGVLKIHTLFFRVYCITCIEDLFGVSLLGKTELEFRPKMPFHALFHDQIISVMVWVSGDV